MSAPPLDSNDELLLPFLKADDSEEEPFLEELLQGVQDLLFATLGRKAVSAGSPGDLENELMSAINLRILEQLSRCKQSFVERSNTVIIRHFSGLCHAIATSTINEYLRLKYPQRARLQNQLLYVIREVKDSNRLPVFALWREVEERICGFREWEGRQLVLTPLHQLLENNPLLAMRKAMPEGCTRSQPLRHILRSMLLWLDSPAAFDSVTQATTHWCGLEEYSEVSLFQSPEEDRFMAFEPAAPDLSPEERLLLNEYLRQLWRDIVKLPPQQCAALLLNLCDAQGRDVLSLLPALEIANFDQLAKAMGMELHQFEALWPRLPLDDREIASLYKCGVSTVSVWRSRARTRLLKNIEEV